MKNFVKKSIKFLFIILLIAYVVFIGKKIIKSDSAVTLKSFNIVSVANNTPNNNDNIIDTPNPFGNNKTSIEDKIYSTFIKDDLIAVDCYVKVNQYVYAIVELNNRRDAFINYIIINDVKYDSKSYEKDSTNKSIKIKINVGNKEGSKEYKLKEISYTHRNKNFNISIMEKNSKKISICTNDNISVSISNSYINNKFNYQFNLKINDSAGLINNGLGKVKVLLYNGNEFLENIDVEANTTITFKNLEKDKLYQFAVISICNGAELSILYKETFYTKEYLINIADTSNGSITVTNKSHGNSTVQITSIPSSGYKLKETYYIEQGKSEKVFFTNSFKMPLNNITVYGTFEKGYSITLAKSNYLTISTDSVGLYQEKINVDAKYNLYQKVISEMYYIEDGKSEKNYFWDYFIMPKANITIYAVIGDSINIRTPQEFNTRLREKIESNVDVILLNNIDLGGVEWVPIGDANNPYTAGIKGNNHTISNFKITEEREYVGLFGYISKHSNGVSYPISNLNVSDFTIQLSYSTNSNVYVGGLAGYAVIQKLSNLTTNGKIEITGTASNVYAGGLLGYFYDEFDLSYSNSDVDIIINNDSFKAYAGGLIGFMERYSSRKFVNNSYATGAVSLKDTINSYRGTIVAYIDAYNEKVLENCYELSEVIKIYTKEDLINLQGNNSGNYKLMNDINLNGLEWIPINFYGGGNFDGNNHKIYNYKINTSRVNNGLFGFVSHAKINDLTITDVNIDYTYNGPTNLTFAGILVGYSNNLKLDNINIKGNITIKTGPGAGVDTGGIAGYIGANSSITNCQYKGNITLDSSARVASGGIVGYFSNSTISKCHSEVNIKSTFGYIGGLAGSISFSEVDTSYTIVDISLPINSASLMNEIGGFVGEIIDVKVTNCYAVGSIDVISNYSIIGGFVGSTSSGIFKNSYTDVDIHLVANDPYFKSMIGGFVGSLSNSTKYGSEFNSCYTLSDIFADTNPNEIAIGGFSSEQRENNIFTNAYKYNNQTIDADEVEINDIGINLTKENIWNHAYSNWDASIWNLYLNQNPTLK